jgi:hypothetical protein
LLTARGNATGAGRRREVGEIIADRRVRICAGVQSLAKLSLVVLLNFRWAGEPGVRELRIYRERHKR